MSRSFADILDAKLDTVEPAETPRSFQDPAAAFYSLRDHYFLRDLESKTFAPRQAVWVGGAQPQPRAQTQSAQPGQAAAKPQVKAAPKFVWTAQARLAWIELSERGLGLFEAELDAVSLKKAWRKLALRIHPDHNNGRGSQAFAHAHANYVKLCEFLKNAAI